MVKEQRDGFRNIFREVNPTLNPQESIDTETIEGIISRDAYDLAATNAPSQKKAEMRQALRERLIETKYLELGEKDSLDPDFWGAGTYSPQLVSVLGIRDGKVIAAVGFNTLEDVMSVLATDVDTARKWLETSGYGKRIQGTQVNGINVFMFNRKPKE